MRRCVFGLLAFATVLTLSSQARAAEVLAYPQWTSSQVRAARPLAQEDALVFDLRAEKAGGAPAAVALSTVTLTASYTLVVTGADHRLDDRTLCRTFTWSDDKPVMDSESCYAFPTFRVTELANRRLIARMLSAVTKTSSLTPAPYWAEAELAVQDQPSNPLVRRPEAGGVDYKLGRETVVRLTGAPVPISAAEAKWFARYLANNQPLHPQVRHDLAAGASLPGRIEIETRVGDRMGSRVLTITNVRRARLDYPVPPGLGSALRLRAQHADTPDAKGIQQALLAIDGTSKLEKPSSEALLSQIQSAAEHKRFVEVGLLFLQFTQQYGAMLNGPGSSALIDRLRPPVLAAKADPTVGRLMDINDLAGDSRAPGDREAAARYLAAARDLDRLPFGTFRYVTFANLVRGSKDTSKWDPSIFKAMPDPIAMNYWVHIAAYPWASNTYKDLGDAELGGYDVHGAWLAYDLGRAVDKGWRSGVMTNVSAGEDALKSMQPDFFQ